MICLFDVKTSERYFMRSLLLFMCRDCVGSIGCYGFYDTIYFYGQALPEAAAGMPGPQARAAWMRF